MKQKNEGLTERLVYDLFESKGYLKKQIIPKKTKIKRIQELLIHASKKGAQRGEPDFFVMKENSDLVILIECKASIEYQKSKSLNLLGGGRANNSTVVADYACDGVIHYASFLKDEYDIIAIGISGDDNNYLIDTFIWKKENEYCEDLDLHEIRTFEDYYSLIFSKSDLVTQNYSSLMQYARDLHNEMRDYAHLREEEKPLLVSGILIALQDDEFANGYQAKNIKGEFIYKDDDRRNIESTLSNKLYNAIESVLLEKEVPKQKIASLMTVYSFIKGKQEFKSVKSGLGENPLRKFVREIDGRVRPYITDEHSLDIVGKFYGEFIRYSGGDGKGLGIVLTPHHITDLFCKLVELDESDKVLDICTGTGAFLIAAMRHEIEQVKGDKERISNIKKNNLVGCEQQSNMFALACSNMILRQDGKSNLHIGSCFDIVKTLSDYKCTKGLINPPYSQKGDGLSELDFIKCMLDCLDIGGIGAAIVPMSCAIDTGKTKRALREKLMQEHTLLGVMSMPTELFYPVGVVTCIMIWQAHKPHNSSIASWFGYWKDDGFVKTKKDGRIDKYNKWEEIEKKWLDDWYNRNERPGECVKAKVTASDEWCAEAYLKTDYSKLTKADFEKVVKDYALFKLASSDVKKEITIESCNEIISDDDFYANLKYSNKDYTKVFSTGVLYPQYNDNYEFTWIKVKEALNTLYGGNYKASLMYTFSLLDICSRLHYKELLNPGTKNCFEQFCNDYFWTYTNTSVKTNLLSGFLLYKIRCQLVHGHKEADLEKFTDIPNKFLFEINKEYLVWNEEPDLNKVINMHIDIGQLTYQLLRVCDAFYKNYKYSKEDFDDGIDIDLSI